MTELHDLIIVGGGPGGLTAGMCAMRAALKAVCIEKGVPGGQVAITKAVENYPGFIEISGFELCDKFLEHAKWYGLEMIQQEVVAVEPGLEFHSVRLASGEVLRTYAVILAAGEDLVLPGRLKISARGSPTAPPVMGSFSGTSPSWWLEVAIRLLRMRSISPRSRAMSPWFTAGMPFGPAGFSSSASWLNPR